MYIDFSKVANHLVTRVKDNKAQYRAPYLCGTTMVPPCCVLDRIIDRRFAEKVKVFQCS